MGVRVSCRSASRVRVALVGASVSSRSACRLRVA